MHQIDQGRRKIEKLTCLVCNLLFDDDYRHEHNKKYHNDLLKTGKSVFDHALTTR